MKAISIDSNLYNNASAYARRHKTSLRHIVESYIVQLVSSDRQLSAEKSGYYISPKVKALESDFKVAPDISSDYKQEISEHRDKKYL